MEKSNPRFLQSSPTAATLGKNRSIASFEGPPPLVNIYDDTEKQYVYQKKGNQSQVHDLVTKNEQIRFNLSSHLGKPIVNVNKERRQSKPQNLIGKARSPRLSPNSKKIVSSEINPTNHLYTTKQRNKQTLHPVTVMEEDDRQQSFAESVYLNLQEYSSIHKYESINPYEEEFDEDHEYAQYLGNDQKHKYGSIGNININLDSEQSYAKRVPNLTILKDLPPISSTPSPFLTPSPIKLKQTQSLMDESTAQQKHQQKNKKQLTSIPNNQQILRNSRRVKQKADYVNQKAQEPQNSHKFSGQFHQFPTESRNVTQSRTNNIGQLTALGLKIFNSCLGNRSSRISNTDQKQEQKSKIFSEIAPDWLMKNNTSNTLRLILTKSNKMSEYLRYLTELQIRIRKHKHNLLLNQLSNRDDTIAQKIQQKPVNNKQITVHYDNEKLQAQGLNQKIKTSSKKVVKQSMASIKSANINGMSYHLPSEAAKSSKAKSVRSDHIQTFNVFTGSNSKNKNRQYPQVISEIHSEMDMDSENKGPRICKDEVEVHGILQVLLFKLRNKKCNVYIKQGNSSAQTNNGDDFLSNTSQKANMTNLFQIFNFNSPKIINTPKTQIAKIEFDEYLDPNSPEHVGGTQMANNIEKIRELTSVLENKEKQLYEIKVGYDYVINNYINTIANLKNGRQSGGQNGEKQQEQMEESKEGSYRQSKPITFQMSKHESFADEDQWIGNPNAEQNQSNDDSQVNKLRHSLPEQN